MDSFASKICTLFSKHPVDRGLLITEYLLSVIFITFFHLIDIIIAGAGKGAIEIKGNGISCHKRLYAGYTF